MTCPSDDPSDPFLGETAHNYAANFGSTDLVQDAVLNGVVFAGAPFGDVSAYLPGDKRRPANPGTTFGIASITDGTSQTLLMAEVIQGQGRDLRGFSWWSDAATFETYLGPNSPLPDRIYTMYHCQPGLENNPPCALSTTALPNMVVSRSRHPGGVNVTMADSSVHFIKNSINIFVWRALSTTHGAEVIGADQY